MSAKENTALNGALYQAREFAELAGVTVRTLHHYDRLGLVKPSSRTAAGYRLYGERELARLQQIAMLKFVGFSLNQIKELLDSRALDLGETLRMQREALESKRRQLELALDALGEAERRMQSKGGRADWEALKKIIEVLEMEQNQEWTKKYYSEGAKADLAKRNAADPDAHVRGEQAWAALIADVDAAVKRGIKPESAEAWKLAERWTGLIRDFTGGNQEVAAGLKKLYADQKNWPTTFKKPYSDEVGAFICAAQAAHKK